MEGWHWGGENQAWSLELDLRSQQEATTCRQYMDQNQELKITLLNMDH